MSDSDSTSVWYSSSDAEEEVPEKIVQYEGGEKEFQHDESVTGFTVKPGVTTIANRAFLGCSNLRSLNGMIGSDVTKVEKYAFFGCRSLESLEGLPPGLEEIEEGAFEDSGLTSLTGLPEVEEIQQNTFYDTRITTLEGLPRNLKRIERDAFSFCPLTSLTSLPDSLTTLNPCAFYDCNSIQDFTRIGPYSFSSCDSLRSAMYHFQESNRIRSSLRFWISSLKRRNIMKLENHPDATPEFIGACSFLLEMRWRTIGEVEGLIYSYLRPTINASLLERYAAYQGLSEEWW